MSACLRGRLLIASVAAAAMLIVRLQAQSAADVPSFDEIYKRGEPINKSLKTLTGRFTETTSSALLTRPLVATGTLAVERPSKVILHYLEPDVRDVLIDGDRLTMSWPSRGIRDVTNISGANRRVRQYFIDSSPRELRESFDIVSERSDRPRTYRLVMTPKRSQIREGLSQLELWLDQGSLLLEAMRMTFPNAETKLLVLTDVVANPPLPGGTFTIVPPVPAPRP